MSALKKYLDKIKPSFEEGGKFHAFRSVFDGFETFMFVPNETAKALRNAGKNVTQDQITDIYNKIKNAL